MQWRESAADRKSEVAVQGVKFETSTLGFTIAWSKISPGRSLKWWLLIHMVSHRDCDSYNLSLNSIELLWIQAVLPWASWRCLDAMQVWSADTWTIWLNPKKIHNMLCTCSSEWTRLGACSQIQPHLRNPSSAHQKNGSLMIQPRCPLRISYLCEFVVGTTFEVIKIFEQTCVDKDWLFRWSLQGLPNFKFVVFRCFKSRPHQGTWPTSSGHFGAWAGLRWVGFAAQLMMCLIKLFCTNDLAMLYAPQPPSVSISIRLHVCQVQYFCTEFWATRVFNALGPWDGASAPTFLKHRCSQRGNCSPCWIVSTVSQVPLGPAGWCLGMPHVVSLNRHGPCQTALWQSNMASWEIFRNGGFIIIEIYRNL